MLEVYTENLWTSPQVFHSFSIPYPIASHVTLFCMNSNLNPSERRDKALIGTPIDNSFKGINDPPSGGEKAGTPAFKGGGSSRPQGGKKIYLQWTACRHCNKPVPLNRIQRHVQLRHEPRLPF